jgi:hypothetical protein
MEYFMYGPKAIFSRERLAGQECAWWSMTYSGLFVALRGKRREIANVNVCADSFLAARLSAFKLFLFKNRRFRFPALLVVWKVTKVTKIASAASNSTCKVETSSTFA